MSDTKRSVTFFAAEEDVRDEDPHYRWKQPVNLGWLLDEDNMTRQELAHGRTREACEEMGRAIAASFMYEADVAPDGWPPNGIDHRPTYA